MKTKSKLYKGLVFGSLGIIACVTACSPLISEKKYIAECEAKRVSGEIKTRAGVIDCARDDIVSLYRWHTFNPELIEQKLSYKSLVASKLDKKQISEDDATLINLEIDRTYSTAIKNDNLGVSRSMQSGLLTNALVNDLNSSEPISSKSLHCNTSARQGHGNQTLGTINCN